MRPQWISDAISVALAALIFSAITLLGQAYYRHRANETVAHLRAEVGRMQAVADSVKALTWEVDQCRFILGIVKPDGTQTQSELRQ